MSHQTETSLTQELKSHILILGGIVALLWIIEIIDFFVFRGTLNRLGIRPHSLQGLEGIFFAPFLHGNFNHLAANTLPLITLGWFVMLRGVKDFFVVTFITMMVSGLGVWLFGSPYTIHIGASGVIFGYLGFLLLRGFFERSFVSIALSLLVGWLYGGLVWGILPLQYGISWQGHLFGFIGGVFAAQMLAQSHRTKA
ncbi:rhomboid family intramembrane serine protease [Planktothrix mougeotii]|uniref:Rhomboid family intramembrane serine protease n=1 Tax=Planktothrix mougeotii LEGE 06226 TaxID=1828728 RepID=A0ABR9UCJ3_9CYAN|nr:rhomboid family intramembrane serine protease [Planktothrix mougeotii]MBE9143891.1 rhomboid family intramembrane serine protease [Planktothrix mougeotii LEGE 06226]